MKRMIALLIVGLLLSLTIANCVSATDEKETTDRNHGPFYVGSKSLEGYSNPGFVVGWYDTIEWVTPTSVGYLYSPHLLFGWDIGKPNPPVHFRYTFSIGLFASRVSFTSFGLSFVGFFSGTEPGFICGFVDDNCYLYGGFP